jgi:hypothetical protein
MHELTHVPALKRERLLLRNLLLDALYLGDGMLRMHVAICVVLGYQLACSCLDRA